MKANPIESINKKIIPEIISKFPNFDKKSVIIDNAIIKTIFPKGFKCLEIKNKPDPEFYSIILDNQQCSNEYIRKYASCLVIYENLSNYISLYNEYNKHNKIKDTKKLENFKEFYIPKCLAIISLFPYIDKYEEILRSIYEIFTSTSINNILLEEIIMKLVIEIPKIPNGLKRIILKLPKKGIELTENKMNELPSIHVNISHSICRFNLEDLIDIYTYLLLETKMIFFSSKIAELSNTILSFLYLLYPLRYQFQIVSVLPRNLFSFCKSLSPFIFGINESYYSHYFSKNKIEIEDSTICVVDIDSGKYYMIAPGAELDENEYPELPKHLREKLENKFNKYYQKLKNNSSKKNIIKDDNKKYQKMFYNFMLYLFKDYPKYLNLDYGVRKTIKMHINYMINIDKYIKSKDVNERNFYKKLLSTQMFIEYIYKRMMPKDCGNKIETLFFEEKIYAKKAKKNFFGISNTNQKNILLSSKEYDYDKKLGEIIDLSSLSHNSNEILNYFIDIINSKNKNAFDNNCLSKGFYIEKNKDNKLKFNYFLFPLLINERIYKINKKNFNPGKPLYKNIEIINAKLVNRIHLKYEHRKIKNSEIENDNYLSYLIIWSLTFWYTDKEEREFRFYQMIDVLDKIEEHEIEICELLFENVVKYGTEENIRLLYKKYIDRKLNPSWKIFSLVSKYLKSNKKSNVIRQTNTLKKRYNNNVKEESLKISKSNKNIKEDKNLNTKIFNPLMFRLRTLKNLDIDTNIFSDDIEFVAYSECKYCKNIINLAKLCSNLSTTKFRTDTKTEVDKIKCPNKTKDNKYCERHSEQKLNFQFGVELFNQDLENESTCSYLYVPLLSPTTIKKKLLSIANEHKNTNFDVELFKKKYSNIFWNCLWYFQLNNMEISFMLPYIKNSQVIDNKSFFNLKLSSKKNSYKMNKKPKKDPKIINTINNDKNKNDKNNNNIVEIYKNNYKEYKTEDLCHQNVFQFTIFKKKGYVNYIDPNIYKENIGFNIIPLVYKKDYNQNKKDIKNKGLRASFWFSTVNRIIDKTFGKKIHHAKNKTETQADIKCLIKELYDDIEEEENSEMRKDSDFSKVEYNYKDIDIDQVECDYKDEYGHFFKYPYKRRGTLNSGLFEDESYLETSFDFED